MNVVVDGTGRTEANDGSATTEEGAADEEATEPVETTGSSADRFRLLFTSRESQSFFAVAIKCESTSPRLYICYIQKRQIHVPDYIKEVLDIAINGKIFELRKSTFSMNAHIL